MMLKRAAISGLFGGLFGGLAGVVAACGLAMAQDKAPEPKPAEQAAPAAPAAHGAAPAAAPEAAAEEKGPTLKVGDKAPALEVEKFLKGTAVTKFEEGKTYVVEFWATWCPPCKKSIPHLTELQKKFGDKGVTIIGVDVSEDRRGPYSDDTVKDVAKFVEDQGEKMDYVVAYDGASKKMDKAYMEAAGAQGIPTAFIVDKNGYVAYIGHPMEMEASLEKIAGGSYDLKQLASEYESVLQAQKLFEKMGEALQAKDEDQYYVIAKQIVDLPGKGDNQSLYYVAMLSSMDQSPVKKKDLDLALRACEKLNANTDNKEPEVLAALAQICFQKGDKAKAGEWIGKAIEAAGKSDEYKEMLPDLRKKQEEYKADK